MCLPVKMLDLINIALQTLNCHCISNGSETTRESWCFVHYTRQYTVQRLYRMIGIHNNASYVQC